MATRSASADSIGTFEGECFQSTIRELKKLNRLESPMSKLEWIYQCCTTQVTKDISAFWKDHDIPQSKLAIDPDNLQGIIIYIVSRLNYPQIITEVHFIEKFIPLGARKSVRNLYLEMIGAACSYLLEVEGARNTSGSVTSQK